MVSVDAYLKAVAAVVSLAIALVVLTARPRRGALPLAIFLGLIALNQSAETFRALAAADEARIVWFKLASIVASLDPFAFAWFAATVAPGVMRSKVEAWLVGGVGAALALAAGWVVRDLPGMAPSSHVFSLALGLYTAIVYVVVLFRATSVAGSRETSEGGHLLPAAVLVAALPAAPRPLDEAFVLIEPALVGRGVGGSFLPLLLAVLAILVLLLILLTRSMPAPTRRALRVSAAFAVAFAILSHVAQIAIVATQLGGLPPPPDLYVLGRIETPLRWLVFGALGSVVVFGTDLLEVPVEVRRRAARSLVALGFLVVGGGSLAVAALVLGDRPVDALYLVVLTGSIALSQGFRRLVGAVATRFYGVPNPTDTESVHALYRRAVADVVSRGGAPAQDAGLDRARRSLGIDRASAAAIEAMVEESSHAPISPGQLVAGRYQVERLVGRGASGRAFLASDLRIGRRVVLKEIMSERADERDMALREARLVGALAHPNVLTVHDALPRPEGWIIVTEFVEGGTLGDAFRAGDLSGERRRAIALGLLDAASAVHERGIVHGDIKPENVILTGEGLPKLADFGTARGEAAGRTVHAGSVLVGTPAFMAPELRSGARATPRSDVYSLGLIFRSLVPGDLTFAPAIERALREDPAQRYASAIEMRSDVLRS